MKTAIIVIAVIAIFAVLSVWAADWSKDQCPRMIAGYNCHGDRCDHSPEAVRQALRDQIINNRRPL